MEKIIIIDGKKYEKIEEHEECSCHGCVLLGECPAGNCDNLNCIIEGTILEKIEGENYD